METKTTIIDAMNAATDAKMKKDTQITNVIFLMDKAEENTPRRVFAFFPDEYTNHYAPPMRQSYSHIGQHSPCHIDYAKGCKVAKTGQYADLKAELESIGYNLNVLKSI